MTFKEVLTRLEATPVKSTDIDQDTTITNDQIAQLRATFETRLAVQGGANAK